MYAELIYSTPEEWGSETVYADEATMQDVIASLIDAGGEDWAKIDLSDCDEWALVREINGLGLYEQMRVRSGNYIALRLVDGDYQEVYFSSMFGRRLATYSSLDDAVEELSE